MRTQPWDAIVAALPILLGLTGCLPVMDIPPLTTPQDRPKNLVERALGACSDKAADAKSDCVKARLAESAVTPARLIALIPGCRPGRICTYDYDTVDRVGYVSAYATHVVYPWHVSFDLTRRPNALGDVPVTVEVR